MKIRISFIKLILLCAFIFPFTLNAQTDYRVQSMFIYNFTSMVNWPAAYQSGDFIMVSYGDGDMYAEFQTMADRRSVGGRPIVARQVDNVNQISKCHIIYVPSRHYRRVGEIVNHLKANNISALVVADARGSIRNGAVVNFTIQGGRQRFEISENNARNLGLNLGGEIVRLGITMD